MIKFLLYLMSSIVIFSIGMMVFLVNEINYYQKYYSTKPVVGLDGALIGFGILGAASLISIVMLVNLKRQSEPV